MGESKLRIEEVTVEPKLIQAYCSSCNCEVRFVGAFKTSYKFHCERCNIGYEANKMYPRIEYYYNGWVYDNLGLAASSKTINKESYQASIEYWKTRSEYADNKIVRQIDEIAELRKELVELKTKFLPPCPPEYRDVNGNCDYEAVKNDITTTESLQAKGVYDGYIEFKVPAGAIIRTDADGKIMYRVKDEKKHTQFTDYLEKKWWANYYEDLEKSIMPGPPKSKRELTYSQCKEIARLIWGRNYIPDMDIRVHKTPIMITMHSRNLHCRIHLNDLSVVNACAHFHPHHNKPIRHPEKIAAKFKEWGIEPLKEKTIFDLREDQYQVLGKVVWPDLFMRDITVEIQKPNAVIVTARSKKSGFEIYPYGTKVTAWGHPFNIKKIHDFLKENGVNFSA